jgi:hypothetical protein
MKETSKANLRRAQDPFWNNIFRGSGIDIGSGNDPFRPSLFKTTSVRPFDVADGDAQDIGKHVKEQFDFVHSSNCLEHLERPQEALSGWWELVKPGGHLVFTVPDEDLYEQGFWPSKWNPEHQWSFTLWKRKSWSPRSINVAELISDLKDSVVLRMQLVNNGYDYDLEGVDQTALGAEAAIEVVLQKRGGVVAESQSFKHSGARGDIIYSLPTIRAMGGGKLYLVRESGTYLGVAMSLQELNWMREMLVGQCGITAVEEWKGQAVQYNLDRFRSFNTLVAQNLQEAHLVVFGATADLSLPWLDKARFVPKHVADIVVSRSNRYDGPLRWHELKGFEARAVFLGFEDEWKIFKAMTGLEIALYQPESYADVCSVLLGSKLFIGNQSFVYALAEALKVNRVQQASLVCPNCLPIGSNGHIVLTKKILDWYVNDRGVIPPAYCQRVRPLRNIRNRFFGNTLPRPSKSILPIIGRPLISCVVITEQDKIPDRIAKGLGVLPSKEIFIVKKSADYREINKVMSGTNGDFLCIIEEGISLEGAWFMEMLGMMGSPAVGAVGQRIEILPVQHLPGGIVMVHRRAWQECGLFTSDTDKWIGFAKRLKDHGYVLRQVRSTSIKDATK